MAERKLAGSEMLLFIDQADDTDYDDLVVCLTNNTFKIANAIIDAKSKCGPDNLAGVQSFEVGFEGQIILSPDANRLGIYGLFNLAKNKTRIGWKMARAVPATGDLIITGSAFIANIDTAFADENPATFNATFGIYGTPSITQSA